MTFSYKSAKKTRSAAKTFFLGEGYPIFVGAITLIGYISGTEFFLNAVNMILLCAGLLITESALPMIPAFSMYVFQTSMINSPESHTNSDYYRNPLIIGVMVGLLLAVLSTAVYIFTKNGNFSKSQLSSLPLPLAVLLLTLAFLANGAFFSGWTIYDTLYGAIMAAEYFLIFYFFYVGLRNENAEKLIDYTVFSTAVCAVLLSAQTLHLYLTNESLISGGEIVKEQVVYGWGMWTMAGQFLAVTIPLCFLGVMRGVRVRFCFTAATLALISAVMTLSRNALLVAGAAYTVCIIACCFVGESKRIFRILTPILGVLALGASIIFSDKIFTLLSDYFERGFSDNGRFELWRHGIESFLAAPVFGKGFFGIQRRLTQGCAEGFSFYPRMMHNTPIQLLGSMGAVGFFAYGYYRYKTLLNFFKKPTLEKTMLGATLLVITVASLIDNFLFLPKHLIFYSIILATAFALSGRDSRQTKKMKGNENELS